MILSIKLQIDNINTECRFRITLIKTSRFAFISNCKLRSIYFKGNFEFGSIVNNRLPSNFYKTIEKHLELVIKMNKHRIMP